MGGEEHTILDEDNYAPLPPINNGDEETEAEELDGDEEDITSEEIADLLSDAQVQGVEDPSDVVPPLIPHGDESDYEEEDEEALENCLEGSDQDNSVDTNDDPPSLVSEPGVRRSGRASNTPEQYDPSSGESYCQTQYCHNLVLQGKFEKKSLEYGEHKTKFVAHLILKIQKDCHAQQFMLGKGLKEFKEEAPPAVKAELKQMHQRTCFRAITVAELTRIERQWSQEGLMLLTRKRSGKVKGRLAYNGKPTRD